MLGMHGTYEANMAMNQADLVVCVGARFDDRVTGRLDAFSPKPIKIHIDIDRASINKTVRVDLPLIGDCATVLRQIIDGWKGHRAGSDRVARADRRLARQEVAIQAHPARSCRSWRSSACSS
jgi:acetolactate synthase-1/2/3 large subunit